MTTSVLKSIQLWTCYTFPLLWACDNVYTHTLNVLKWPQTVTLCTDYSPYKRLHFHKLSVIKCCIHCFRPTQSVSPEDGLSGNNSDVTWLFPASSTMARMVAAGKYSILNSVFCLSINSAQPIPVSAFEETMHHLSRYERRVRLIYETFICFIFKSEVGRCKIQQPRWELL